MVLRANVGIPSEMRSDLLKTLMRTGRALHAREKNTLVFLAIVRSATGLIDLAALALLASAVTLATGGRIPQQLEGLLGDSTPPPVGLLLVVSGALFLFRSFTSLLLTRVSARYLAHLETTYTELVAGEVFRGNLSNFRRFSRQQIEWALLRSTENLLSGFVGQMLQVLSDLTLMVLIVTLFFLTDPLAAALILTYLILIAVGYQSLAGKRIRRAGEALTSHSVTFSRVLSDMVSSFREMAVLNASDAYLAKLNSARSNVAFARASDQFISAIPRAILEAGLVVGAIIFAGLQVSALDEGIDYGALTIFIAGSLRLMSVVLPLQRSVSNMLFLKGPSESGLDFIERSIDDRNETSSRGPVELGHSPVMTAPLSVDLSRVSFEFPDDNVEVLSNISLGVRPGQVVAFVGRSGAGKSTLADLIIGLHEPSAGVVRLSGLAPSDLRNLHPGAIGYVPQKPGIVSGTILENLALGVPPSLVDPDRAEKALRDSALYDVVLSLDEGMNSQLGEQQDGLSGGQLQRLGLARALYFAPRLLILDEATSALDPETEAAISESINRLRSTCTVIVIAHRLTTIKNADQIFLIDNGKNVAQGDFSSLRKKSDLFRNFIQYSLIDNSRI